MFKYKLYVCRTSIPNSDAGVSTHTLVIEFATKEEADYAAKALKESKIVFVVKLYPPAPKAED